MLIPKKIVELLGLDPTHRGKLRLLPAPTDEVRFSFLYPYETNAYTISYSSVVKEINKINQAELDLGISGASWHDEYKDSAYIFVGGLHFDLTEGDVITIFSQ
jgi:hypothetical protein